MNWYQFFVSILMFAAGYTMGRHSGWLKGFNTAKNIHNGTYEEQRRNGWLT